MTVDDSWRELKALVWMHVDAQEFARAEPLVRRLIDITDPADCLRLWNLFGVLAGVLTELNRPEEATVALRRALSEARRAGPSAAVDAARYMLANHHLHHGDPQAAVSEAEPFPSGKGHTQCLLHSVVALAHWKLGHTDEAKASARSALDTAPTEERMQDLSKELREILSAS